MHNLVRYTRFGRDLGQDYLCVKAVNVTLLNYDLQLLYSVRVSKQLFPDTPLHCAHAILGNAVHDYKVIACKKYDK